MTALYIVLGIPVFIFLMIVFAVAPGRGCKPMRAVFMNRMLAHRGLHTKDRLTPENSMKAFAAAIEAGYGIEFDLQLSKDEQIVVFHDDTLNRVCNVDNRVDFYTYDELLEFSLCDSDEKIPLFTDVLKLVKGKVPLLIELKNGPRNDLLCQKTLDILKDYSGDFCIESFSPFIVAWFRKHAPNILRGQLAGPAESYKGAVSGPAGFLLSHCLLNFLARPHFISYNKEKRSLPVKLADKMGAMRFVWTVRPKDDHHRLYRINDSSIFEFYTPKVYKGSAGRKEACR